MKIAIIVREETMQKCTGRGCFRAFNQRIDAFERYKGMEVELVSFMHNGGDLDHKINRLREAEVDTIHLSTCMRASSDDYGQLAETLSKEFNIVGYTHGGKDGKIRKTISIKCSKKCLKIDI